jgi:hypothetical protein
MAGDGREGLEICVGDREVHYPLSLKLTPRTYFSAGKAYLGRNEPKWALHYVSLCRWPTSVHRYATLVRR